jgi:hypothetical protein
VADDFLPGGPRFTPSKPNWRYALRLAGGATKEGLLLMCLADDALYAAKAAGRNTYRITAVE